MSFKQLTPKDITKIPKRCKCKESIQCNTIVVSAKILFKKLFYTSMSEQKKLFGLSGLSRKSPYIYLNNFCIMIDTVFRMIYNFGEYYNKYMRKFNAKQFIIIDDILNPQHGTLEENAIKVCPIKGPLFNYVANSCCYDNTHYKHMMWKLKNLCKFLDEDELEDYDCWEVLLSRMFPDLYDFGIHARPYTIKNYYMKQRKLSKFLYLATLTQIQLSQVEIYVCWRFVLRQLRKQESKEFMIYECDNGDFDYNITHIFNKQRTLFITDKYVNVDNIFFYNKNNIFYPCADRQLKLKDYPNEEVKLIKRIKRKKEGVTTMMDLFDVCEKECNGKILDINSAYSLNIFSDMKKLYVDGLFDELMPDKIEETEYSWITKECYSELMNEWIRAFNAVSKFKVLNE